MKIYIVTRQTIPDSKIIAVERNHLAAMAAAAEDARQHGNTPPRVWEIPDTERWTAHGISPDDSSAYYELTEWEA